MKKIFAIAGTVVVLLAVGTSSASATPSCNWGELTSAAIADGFEQGPHSSSFAGSKRAGLANVVNQGDLNATCELIKSAL